MKTKVPVSRRAQRATPRSAQSKAMTGGINYRRKLPKSLGKVILAPQPARVKSAAHIKSAAQIKSLGADLVPVIRADSKIPAAEPLVSSHAGLADSRSSARPRDALPGISSQFSSLEREDTGHLAESANAGDHAAIDLLLTSVFHNAARDEFLASLEDPLYEPCDRLVARHEGSVVSHLHMTKRVMQFDGMTIPVTGIQGLATLHEYRGRGFARRLMQLADRKMKSEGCLVGLLTTRIPFFFRPCGWAACGRTRQLAIGTRELLAYLSSKRLLPERPTTRVRPWRQVELPALMRVHEKSHRGVSGTQLRTEAQWRWLLGCRDIRQVLVAIDGPEQDPLSSTADNSHFVGYVVRRDHHILELATVNDDRQASIQLLVRACADAIEQDVQTVILHAPCNDPLLGIVHAANGSVKDRESSGGDVFMARLVDPLAFVQQIEPILVRRAKDARLGRTLELGILLEREKLILTVTRSRVRWSKAKLGRSYISLNLQEFTRLALGQIDVEESLEQGRMEASSKPAVKIAKTLFPRLAFWRPPWDEILY